jgi:hypothetical protein
MMKPELRLERRRHSDVNAKRLIAPFPGPASADITPEGRDASRKPLSRGDVDDDNNDDDDDGANDDGWFGKNEPPSNINGVMPVSGEQFNENTYILTS